MCGLAGVISNFLITKEITLFKQLLVVSSLRGWHSTGAAIIGKRGKTYKDGTWDHSIVKDATNPIDYLLTSDFDTTLKEFYSSKAILGHARFATKGDITAENAHPFQCGEIIGTHNGTLRGDYPHKADFATDSEALFTTINESTLKETLQHIEDNGGGAYALVYYDHYEHTVNFIRNSERTLYIAICENGSIMYYASEKAMLELVLGRDNVKINDLFLLGTNTLLTVDLEHIRPAENCIIEKNFIKPKPVTVYHYGTSYYYGNHNKPGTSYVPKTKEETSKTQTTTDKSDIPWYEEQANKEKNKVVHLPATRNGGPSEPIPPTRAIKKPKNGQYKGFNGILINNDDADKLLNHGCAWCSSPATRNDPVRWIGATEFICDGCKDDKYIQEYLGAANSLH